LYENFQKASRAAQKVLAGRMRPAGRVFETPGLGESGLFLLLTTNTHKYRS